ncbi:MAG: tRNA (N(6)-L-threonylcarbamoyladenosine(37)-C(2))-methylthiotransferase MtaB [Lachnospiraceae bacterium]|nr:tRNA (N(6)-L-threonylcarbamoyladenosine(37)-C(2))-methylthiotransferase MtaB [Lachnospiraceae bacterium]
MRWAALHSLGCKVNSYETEAMQQMLEEAGYEIVPFHQKADVYVVNTCSVTNVADRKSRQMIHRARKLNPEAIVVAAGCYVQTSPEQAAGDAAIDIVIGNNCKKNLIALLEEYESNPGRKNSSCRDKNLSDATIISRKNVCPANVLVTGSNMSDNQETDDNMTSSPEMRKSDSEVSRTEVALLDINQPGQFYEELHVAHPAEHTRAFLKVQDGCNQFCSYCIIPYARGRVRSRKLEDVVRETKELVENGFQEIVLTGIHLSSYGIDLGYTLLDLIRSVHAVEGIRRIRLGSLEPGIVTEEFVSELAKMEKVCPHFHLSLQSGSDTVLRRMNRKYTAEEYFHKCEILRQYYEHPALTTDIIVGFPGETEEEFAETCAFAKRVSFYEIHVFQYSRRKGTAADRMEGQIPSAVKAERSHRLMTIAAEQKKCFAAWYEGKTAEVLFEEAVTIDGETFYEGFTPEYVKIRYRTEESLENKIMKVEFFQIIV